MILLIQHQHLYYKESDIITQVSSATYTDTRIRMYDASRDNNFVCTISIAMAGHLNCIS